jgi:hypothetical protein
MGQLVPPLRLGTSPRAIQATAENLKLDPTIMRVRLKMLTRQAENASANQSGGNRHVTTVGRSKLNAAVPLNP